MVQTITFEQLVTEGFQGISGTHYRLESEVVAARYAKMQEYLLEAATNMNASDVMRLINGAYTDLQAPKLMDAGEKLRKILEFSKHVPIVPHPAMKACAMFVNRANDPLEKRIVFDESDMMEKCNDWQHIGLPSFFGWLSSFNNGLSQNFSANSSGSQEVEEALPTVALRHKLES